MLRKSYLTLVGCFLCSLLLFQSLAFAVQQADFSWLPNDEANLTGYKIYYSTVSGQYGQTIDVGDPGVVDGVVQATVPDLADGTTYYFAATAYDSDGFESDYSQEVIWTSPVEVPVTPPPPPVEEPVPPVANAMSVYLDEDNTVTGMLDGQSQDGLPLGYQLVTTGSIGTVSIIDNTVGSFTYTPITNMSGMDSFTYKVSDANGESAVATVTVSIHAVNDVPSAESASFSTDEDVALSGVLSAGDIDNDQLVYSIVDSPSFGELNIINTASGLFDYVPYPNAFGADSFTFQVTDGAASSNSATVQINVAPVNDSPVASSGTLTAVENVMASGILLGSDIDSSQLSFSIVSSGLLGSAAIVDPDAGTYTYTPHEGAYGDDTFQFMMSDGSSESNVASVTVHIERAEAPFAMEIGEINVDGTWVFISFTENFRNPVVVAKPASSNDPTPCVVRIRNVSSSGFEIRLQNYDYIAEEHGLEHISYVAIEQGSFILENGKRVEAGMFNTDLNDYPETIAFAAQFPVMPVVAASIVTENEYDAVVSRVDFVTENGFDYQMQEQEANSPLHTFEDVAYIAWEPFIGMIGNFAFEISVAQDEVDDQWQPLSFQQGFDKTPVLIAGIQSNYGRDTANLRHAELKANGVEIKVAEEQSIDSETDHASEDFSFMAISDIDLEGDADNDGLITVEERDLYGTSPGVVDTDEDGLDDGAEVSFWGVAWELDADNDGIVNLLDPDSDNDGFMDGEEVEFGFDPGDSGSNPDAVVEPAEDPVTTIITLEVNATKIRGKRTAELFWSGASGDFVQITRIRENNEVFTVTVANENYYKEILAKSGTYTYQVCETDGSVCSDVITVGL
jgi:hypothetical protein